MYGNVKFIEGLLQDLLTPIEVAAANWILCMYLPPRDGHFDKHRRPSNIPWWLHTIALRTKLQDSSANASVAASLDEFE